MSGISVIIPFYQCLDWLEQALESVYAQTRQPDEVIVVSDGAEEDAAPLCAKYSRLIFLRETHRGAAAARMTAIRQASGEFLAFLDADDLWVPDKLEKQMSLLESGEYVWSATAYRTFGRGKEKIVTPFCTRQLCYQLLYSSAQIGTPTVMVKRSLFMEDPSLGFALDQAYGEDTLLWWRLAARFPLGVLDEPLSKVRLRGENAHLTGRANIAARAALWKKLRQGAFDLPIPTRILTRTGYSLCGWMDKAMGTKRLPKTITRACYALPWLLFRIDDKAIRKELRPNNG